jgi:methylglutaconyl-CoA hydratase
VAGALIGWIGPAVAAGVDPDAAPGAVADSKKLVHDFAGREIDRDLGHKTAKRIAARRASDEGKEGIAAFLEKRAPVWKV